MMIPNCKIPFKNEPLIRCLHTEGVLWRNPCSSARSVNISMVTQLRSARTIPVLDVCSTLSVCCLCCLFYWLTLSNSIHYNSSFFFYIILCFLLLWVTTVCRIFWIHFYRVLPTSHPAHVIVGVSLECSTITMGYVMCSLHDTVTW